MEEKIPAPSPVADNDDAGPDYDDLPREDNNPMWEVAIGIGVLLSVFAAVIALG